MVVAGVGGAHAQKTGVLIHRLHHRGEHEQEHPVFLRIAPRFEQVVAGVRRQRPVVVLAASVDPREGFFMQQAYQPVAQGNLFHDVHNEHVFIRRHVGGVVDGRKLMLRGRGLVVLRLGRDAELPQLDIQILHVVAHTFLDRAEVVILHLLPFGRHRAEKRPPGEDEILALQIGFAIDDEIFLLRADGCGHALGQVIAEEAADAHGLTADGLHRAQQRRFLVERLAVVAAERRGDAQRFGVAVVVEKRGAGDIPDGVAARLERGADAAGGEGGSVRLAANQFLAAQLHDDAAVLLRADEGIVLFGGGAGQRLEPVGVMRSALLNRPRLHGAGGRVRHGGVKLLAGRHAGGKAFVNLSGQARAHLLIGKNAAAVKRRNIQIFAHACSPWAVFLPRSHRRREGCIPYYNTPFDPKLQLRKAFRPNRFVFSVFMPFFFGFCGSFCRWYFLCRRFLCRRPFRPPRFQHKMKMPRSSRFFKTDDARGGGQNHLAAARTHRPAPA